MVRPIILLALVALGACSSPGDLTYVAPAQIVAGPAVVADVTVTDKRDEKPNRVATIRGGYGNPVKVMDTTKPVATEVQDVFVKALTLRGMLRSGAPTHFEVVLHTLYGDQFMGRKVDLMFDLIVRDDTNRVIYSDRVTGKDYEFTFFRQRHLCLHRYARQSGSSDAEQIGGRIARQDRAPQRASAHGPSLAGELAKNWPLP